MTVAAASPRVDWSGPSRPARLLDVVRRRPEVLTALLCGVVVAVGLRGPDLPAQAYRVSLVRHHGWVVFDSHWYGGHSVPGYSLLFPPLAALLGSRLVGALACVAAVLSVCLSGATRHAAVEAPSAPRSVAAARPATQPVQVQTVTSTHAAWE